MRGLTIILVPSEKKIDYFGNRLAGIENLLRELTISLKNNPPSTSTTSVASAAHTTAQRHASATSTSRTTPSSATANPIFDGGDDTDASSDLGDHAFEGTSSLAAHTVQASAFLEHVVERERWNNQQMSPNMQAALSSLQQIVDMQQRGKKSRMMGATSRHEVEFTNQKPIPPGGLKELPMPPVQTVIAMLRDIKGRVVLPLVIMSDIKLTDVDNPPVTFTMICAFIAVEDFTEACRKVYFATEDFSPSTFIVVNAGLYELFQEKFIIMDENSGTAAEYMTYHLMCRDNLETALANLPLFLPPKTETVEALLLGVSPLPVRQTFVELPQD